MIFLWFGLAISLAYADPGRRELCRQIVAGEYLKLHNEIKRSEELQQLLQRKEKKFVARISEYKKPEASVELDLQKKREQDAAASVHENIVRLHQENQAILAQVSRDLAKSKDRLKTWEPKVLKVFLVEPLKQNPSFPYALRYRQDCPKFREQCTLSKAEAFDLLAIFEQKVPTDCERYAAQSGIERH